MKNLTSITLIFALASIGCSRPDEMLISNAFTSEEEELVQAAMDEWETALDTELVDLTFGWQPIFEFDEDTFNSEDGKATMHIVEKHDDAYQSIAFKYDKDFSGYTRYLTTWSIVIVRQDDPEDSQELNDQRFYHVVLHEFGHYLGHYKHSGHKNSSLMAKTSSNNNPFICINQDVVDYLCGMRWECGPAAGSTCKD